MQTLHCTILINADKKKVWNTMLNENTYREWTKEFHADSSYEGNWNKDSEIRFIAPDQNGKRQGIFSRIKENILYQFISIEHLGLIVNGEVDTVSEEAKKWMPSFENYTFTENNGETELTIEMQVEEEYKSMFEAMWKKALTALKLLCEK
ncbi:MAG: hypothetical protein AAB071_02545 [Bacteroidota bacterium]